MRVKDQIEKLILDFSIFFVQNTRKLDWIVSKYCLVTRLEPNARQCVDL
jgi:hypothetical protein